MQERCVHQHCGSEAALDPEIWESVRGGPSRLVCLWTEGWNSDLVKIYDGWALMTHGAVEIQRRGRARGRMLYSAGTVDLIDPPYPSS